MEIVCSSFWKQVFILFALCIRVKVCKLTIYIQKAPPLFRTCLCPWCMVECIVVFPQCIHHSCLLWWCLMRKFLFLFELYIIICGLQWLLLWPVWALCIYHWAVQFPGGCDKTVTKMLSLYTHYITLKCLHVHREDKQGPYGYIGCVLIVCISIY